MCLHVLSGATPAASLNNFSEWLDAVIQGMTKHNTLVFRGPTRQIGFYHKIMMNEFLEITSVLSQAFRQWGRGCVAAGHSCGACYYVGGAGVGSSVMSFQAEWGPFLGE